MRRSGGISGYGTIFEIEDVPVEIEDEIRERLEHVAGRAETRRIPFMPWAMQVPVPGVGTLDFDLFPFQREWYSDEIVYRRRGNLMKATQVGACLDPETKVLTADLTWVRMDDLNERDEIVCVDEERPRGGGAQRYVRLGEVEKKWDVYEEAIRLTMEDGAELVATPDHRFLCEPYNGAILGQGKWRKVGSLAPGDAIRRIVTTTWDEPDYEDGWMAGLLDGEGSLRVKERGGTEIVLTQQLGDSGVYERVRAYLGARGYAFAEAVVPKPGSKPVGRLVLTRRHEILRLIGTTRTTRWPRWWVDRGVPGKSAGRLVWGRITKVERLGRRRMVDLQTSARTYIANGYVSHNSEYAVRWAMFFPDTRGDTGLYVFPATRQLRDFSDQRVKQLIRGSEYLRRRVPYGYIDNKLLKQIGYGFLNFRGSKNVADLESVPADEVVLDEHDLLVQSNVPAAEKRLSAPTSRDLLRRVGWPTYSDMGIHGKYEASDKREWFVKCRKCRKELPLRFYLDDGRTAHYVDTTRAARVCANCETPLKPQWIAEGRWVAEHPDRDEFGYHVSRLMLPTADVPEIIRESKLTRTYEIETFWRKTLGLPYDSAEGRLSREAIQAAISAGGNYFQEPWDAGYTGNGLVTAGIDVASVRNLNVKISEHLTETRKRTLFVGEVDSFERLATMLVAFKVNCACIDHLPDGRLARALANRLAGIVFVHSWNDQRKQVLNVDEEMREVSTHRTTVIDAALDMIRKQNNLLPVNLPEDYVKHMRSAVRFQEEDEESGEMEVGYRIEGPHDYLQAEAYDVAATETWWALHLKGRAEREVLRPLDEMLEFRRTRVQDYAEQGYSPGPQSEFATWDDEVAALEQEYGSTLPDEF